MNNRESFIKIIEKLNCKYKDVKAKSLNQVKEENPDICFFYLNNCTNDFFGMTAKAYLVDHGIIEGSRKLSEDEAIDEAKAGLRNVMYQLSEKYHNHKAETFFQIIEENRNLQITSLNAWTKLLFGISAKEYLVEQGIVRAPRIKSEAERKEEARIALENVMTKLSERYHDNKAGSYTQIVKDNKDLPIASLNIWIRLLYGVSAKEYLVEQGIVLSTKERDALTDIITVEEVQSYQEEVNTDVSQSSFSAVGNIVVQTRLDRLVELLSDKYATRKAHDYKQIEKENDIPDLDLLNAWTMKLHGKTSEEYLIEKGIIDNNEKPSVLKKLYELYDIDYSEYLITDVADLDISGRTRLLLKRCGIGTAGKLLQYSIEELKSAYGFGNSAEKEVLEAIERLQEKAHKGINEIDELKEDMSKDKTESIFIDETNPIGWMNNKVEHDITEEKPYHGGQQNLCEVYKLNPKAFSFLNIDSIGFSVRTTNCLIKAGLLTIEDVLLQPIEEIERIRAFGANCKKELLQYLETLNSAEDTLVRESKRTYAKKFIKENKHEVLSGNFNCEAFSNLDPEELEHLELYKEAYNNLGEEIIKLFNIDTKKAVSLLNMVSSLSSSIDRQRQNEHKIDTFYNRIPMQRLTVPFKFFVEGYLHKNENDSFMTQILQHGEALTLGEAKSLILKYATITDYYAVERFLTWCAYDYKASIDIIINKINSKDRWKTIIEGRASGATLEELGKKINVTRERVRQIERKVKNEFLRWDNKEDILYHIFADRNGDRVLTTAELQEYLGEHYDTILHLLQGTSELYDDRLDVFLIGESISIEDTQIYIDNLPDVLSEEEMHNAIDNGVAKHKFESELLESLLLHEYALYGKLYSRKRVSLGTLYQEILKKYYPNGLHVYDDKELQNFRRYFKKEYDKDLTINNRALSARIAGVSILAGRGVYKAKKEKYISDNLKNSIHEYIINNPSPMISTGGVFNNFKNDLMSFDIDNRYYLHGVLGEIFGDEFYYKRDYICKNDDAVSMHEEIVSFIERHEFPVSKEEIMDYFQGVTPAVITFSIEDERIINLFGEYIHVNNLSINESETQYLRELVNKVVIDEESYHVKDIYARALAENKSLLERLNIEQAFGLFSILQYLFDGEFEMSRPYIAKKNVVIGRAYERINDIFNNNDEVVLSEVLDFAKENYYTIYSIIEFILEHTDTHLLVNKEVFISIDRSGLDETLFRYIESKIFEEVVGTVPISNLKCIHKFDRINVPWDEWLVFSAVHKWSTLLEVSTIGNQFKQAVPVISKKGEMNLDELQTFVNTGTFVMADDISNIDSLIIEDLDFEFGELD